MQVFMNLMKNSFFLILIALVFILIALMPRKVVYDVDRDIVLGIHHSFTFNEYKEHVTNYVQYVIEHKSLGTNRDGTPIEDELSLVASRSLKLIIPSFILSLILGVMKGIYDHRYRSKKRSLLGNGTTWFFQTIPDFFIVIAFQYAVLLLIRKGFPKLPLFGFTEWYHLVLPTIFLTLFTSTYVARITSSLLLEQEGQEYIRTAVSKGVSPQKILYKHMLKNCLSKLFDYLPMIMIVLLTHLLIIEHLMYYQGIAVRFIESFELRTVFRIGTQFPIRHPIIIGTILFITILLLITEWIRIVGKSLVNPYMNGGSK